MDTTTTTRIAKIVDLEASWNSGLAVLVLEHDDGSRVRVAADNGPLVRALDSAFSCIAPGHAVDVARLRGRRISYSVDAMGLLESFFPEEI